MSNYRQLLSRATEGTSAPTPGYLYKDLAQAAASNPSASQEMATWLIQRLQNKQHNTNISAKCLKVITKLCDDVPRNQFRRALSQHPQAVGVIKQAMNFRGPPDPVRGDEPNQRVRQAAQEALDAVYRETPSSEQATSGGGYASSGGSGMAPSYGAPPSSQYYGGSSSGMGGGGGSQYSSSRMQGIGNPRYSDPRLDPRYNPNNPGGSKVQEVVREAGEVVMGMIKDPLARNSQVPVPQQGHSGNLPGYGSSQYAGRPPPGSAELSRQTGGQWTMASNRGPAAVVHNEEYYKARDTSYQWAQQQVSNPSGASASRGGVGGSWATPTAASSQSHSTPSITITPNPSAPSTAPTGNTGTAVSDGSYEKNLVMELCPPGGTKAVPPPDKLAAFAKAVPSLNSDLVAPVLLDLLEEGQPWIIRAKALCVMDTCIQYGTKQSDNSNPYRDFFHACQEEIVPLASHPRTAVKEPAKRVLILLGLEDAANAAAPPVAAAPVARAPNLLDFDEAPPPATAPPPPPSQAPPPPPPGTEPSALFGGMQVKSKAPAAATPASAVNVAAPAPTSGNLLDFGAPSPATNIAAPAPSNTGSDIFRDVAVKQENTNGNISAPSSMFAEMNLKVNSIAEDKKAESEDAGDLTSVTANGSSAFGFINESASADGGTKSGPEQQSFDPLKNQSPNTAQKKIMQLSPEQMQAMAYQQMMMQQQMQQMQMAYAMQQQRGGAAGPMPTMPPMHPGMFMSGGMAANPGGKPNAATASFSFMDNKTKPAKKDDKKFDFVKDAMQTESKKN